MNTAAIQNPYDMLYLNNTAEWGFTMLSLLLSLEGHTPLGI